MEGSLDVVRSEMDLFSEAPLQRTIEKFQLEEIFSVNNVKTDGTITFHVRGAPNQWIDLDDTYLMIRYRVKTHDGNNIANQADTCIRTIEEPNLFHNLWSKVEMSIDSTPIKSVVNPYPLRPYIENLLTTPKDGLDEKYHAEGFYKEKAGDFDHDPENTVARVKSQTSWRQEVQMKNKGSPQHVLYGKLAVDLWRQGRNIPPNHDLRLDLTKNRPQFYLRSKETGGEEHKLVLEEAKLIVKRVHLYDDTQANLDGAMAEAGVIKYPIRRVDVKTHAVGRGVKVFQENNIISGQIPSRVIIGMVDNDAISGSYDKSPFNFQHYKVEELYLHFNGEIYPSNMYRPSFTGNKDALVPWLNLKKLVTPGQPFFNHTISYEDFLAGGYTLWVIDMSQDNKCGVAADYNNVRLNGDVRLNVRFGGDGLSDPITIVVFAEYENQIEVGRNRDVMQDY